MWLMTESPDGRLALEALPRPAKPRSRSRSPDEARPTTEGPAKQQQQQLDGGGMAEILAQMEERLMGTLDSLASRQDEQMQTLVDLRADVERLQSARRA